MAINAEVQKSGNETALSTIRKFSRRVQGTGLIRTVRAARYFSKDSSKTVRKKRALKLIKRRAEYRQQIKEGKVADFSGKRGPHRSSPFFQASTRAYEQAPQTRPATPLSNIGKAAVDTPPAQ